jgi:hypothetical protein
MFSTPFATSGAGAPVITGVDTGTRAVGSWAGRPTADTRNRKAAAKTSHETREDVTKNSWKQWE